jgi:hypothetical protein
LRFFPNEIVISYVEPRVASVFYGHPDDSYFKRFTLNLISGTIVGTISLLIVYPLDFIATRLAADVSPNGGSVRDIISETW